jgi:hypothetical protein
MKGPFNLMKSRQIPFRILLAVLALVSVSTLTPLLRAAERAQDEATSREDFFIISSVDAAKKQIVLKRPTEVTELIRVSEKTVYLDEQGKAIEFKSLRAGDTVYVSSSPGPDGKRIVNRIRRGPMTLEELHRRYVPFQ